MSPLPCRALPPREAVSTATTLDRTVEEIAARNALPSQLLHSVIKVESNYNAMAVSPKGALGMMQLIPATARRFGVGNVFNATENIEGGAKYLRYLLDLFGNDYRLAIAAYNAGEGAVAKYGGVPPYAETQNYVTLVRKQLEAQLRKPASETNQPAKPAQPSRKVFPTFRRLWSRTGPCATFPDRQPYEAARRVRAFRNRTLCATGAPGDGHYHRHPALVSRRRHTPSHRSVARVPVPHGPSAQPRARLLRLYRYPAQQGRPPRLLAGDLDNLVTKVRVAETLPGVTRVVLDLGAAVEVSTSQLTNPDRLIIELRVSGEPPAPVVTSAAPVLSTPPPVARPEVPKTLPAVLATNPVPAGEQVTAEPNKAQLAKAAPPEKFVPLNKPAAETPKPTPILPAETGKAAKPTSSGSTSLVRALGLKIGRIVIDPGHGGHDQGTEGPRGCSRKIWCWTFRCAWAASSRRSSERRLSTRARTTRSFRSKAARPSPTKGKADLFLSVHANSSPVPRIAGVETYYLNFTDAKDAMDVASRENASSRSPSSNCRTSSSASRCTIRQRSRASSRGACRKSCSNSPAQLPRLKNRGVKQGALRSADRGAHAVCAGGDRVPQQPAGGERC